MYLLAPCLGIIYIFLLSNLIFRKLSFSYFLITLFIVSSPVPILAYTNASYIKNYFYVSLAITIIFSLFKHFKKIDKVKFAYLKKNIFQDFKLNKKIFIFLFSLLISFLLLLRIYPYYFRFEARAN